MSKIDRQKVYDRFGGKCSYCGCTLNSIKDMQVDHQMPKSMPFNDMAKYKMLHAMDNLYPSCRTCNHYKRSDNLEQFRYKMITLHERVCSHYIGKVALKYGIVQLNKFDGVFYFEKQTTKCYE